MAPASGQPQRDADDGDRLPVLRVARAQPVRQRVREHRAGAVRRLLDLPVRHGDPDAADERAAADALRPPARGLVPDPARDWAGRMDDDRPRGGPSAARVPRRGPRARDRPGPARSARGLLPGDRRRGRRPVVEVDPAAAPRAAAEPRRRLRAAVLRDAARQRPRRRNALADAAVDRGLLARDRAAGVPGRAAALAAGARRPRRPVPRARDDERRGPAGGAPARARRSEPGAGARRVCRRGRRPRRRAGRAQRAAGRRARPRRLARRGSRAARGGLHGDGRRAREPAPPGRGRRAARRAEGVARADRRRRRRGAPAARAQPARRRAAAAGGDRAASAHCCRTGSATTPTRRSWSRPRAPSSPRRWRSCGSSPAGCIRRCSSTGSRRRSTRWRTARRSRPRCRARCASGCPIPWSSPPTSSRARRSPTSRSTRARRTPACACGGPGRSPRSRSPTTASAAPTTAAGSGLRGLADRVEALDGRLYVTSPPGAGTTITAELPCES